MAVVIHEIVTELVVAAAPTAAPAAGSSLDADREEAIVRRATERVLEILRREWDQ